MLLYLVRHAIAVERPPRGEDDDFSRALTSEGRKKFRHHAEVLRRMQVTLEDIWTSPLVRARQTAELLAAGLECAARVEIVDALRPDGRPHDVLGTATQRERASLALVGHEPYLSELASILLTARRGDAVEMKKGGVACVEIEDPTPPVRGRLLWLLTPKAMALMS